LICSWFYNKDAIKYIKQDAPDLILLDMNVPSKQDSINFVKYVEILEVLLSQNEKSAENFKYNNEKIEIIYRSSGVGIETQKTKYHFRKKIVIEFKNYIHLWKKLSLQDLDFNKILDYFFNNLDPILIEKLSSLIHSEPNTHGEDVIKIDDPRTILVKNDRPSRWVFQ
jgi:CheY-like chemotaxis protein